MNAQEHIADILRRIRALKATRRTSTSQIYDLQYSQTFSVTIAGGATAIFTTTINCGGPPIADVSIDGLAQYRQNGIIAGNNVWSISGNIATCQSVLINYNSASDTRNVTITAYAINGISATIARAS